MGKQQQQRSFCAQLSWTIDSAPLGSVLEHSTPPLLVKILRANHKSHSILHDDDIIFIYKIERQQRVLCQPVDKEDVVISVGLDYKEKAVVVLPEKPTPLLTPLDLSWEKQALWVRPTHTELAYLSEESALWFGGCTYRDHTKDKIVLKGTSGTLFFVELDSTTRFEVLRRCESCSIRAALDTFSIPLTFRFESDFPMEKPQTEWNLSAYFGANEKEKGEREEKRSLTTDHVTCKYFVESVMVHCCKLAGNGNLKDLTITWLRLPQFVLDTQVLTCVNTPEADLERLRFEALIGQDWQGKGGGAGDGQGHGAEPLLYAAVPQPPTDTIRGVSKVGFNMEKRETRLIDQNTMPYRMSCEQPLEYKDDYESD